jgi:hypothetical protein
MRVVGFSALYPPCGPSKPVMHATNRVAVSIADAAFSGAMTASGPTS